MTGFSPRRRFALFASVAAVACSSEGGGRPATPAPKADGALGSDASAWNAPDGGKVSTPVSKSDASAEGGNPEAGSEDAGAEATVDGSGASPTDAGEAGAADGDGPSDRQAPEIRSALVDTEGPLGRSFDLSAGDVRHVLPMETTALFTVFARDDRTAYADLRVTIVNAKGDAVAPVSSTFSNGLFRVRVTVTAGETLGVRVTDAAGNAADAPGRLVLPSPEQAVAGSWVTRFFAPTKTVAYRWHSTWNAPDWTETQDDTGLVHGGTFAFSGSELWVTESRRSSDPADASDGALPASERRADYYVDDTAFSDRPFHRIGVPAGTGLTDTWQRSYRQYAVGGAGPAITEDVTETLTLAADLSWELLRTGSTYPGGTTTPLSESFQGVYREDTTSSYSAESLYFLARTVTEENGSPVAGQPESFEIYLLRGPFLMLSPMQR